LATFAPRSAQKGVTYLKGDWTNNDPEITRILIRHGRSGVPLYLFYQGGEAPVVLPQVLTESMLLDHMARL
jgi:thiol:disulfide interchange protein DsbD